MLIQQLELTDFKSYEHAIIRFMPGMNAILGENGAGKSSILEAVGLALFGHAPPSTKRDQLVREGKSTARIRITFVSGPDQQRYEIERRLGKSNVVHLYQASEADPDESVRIAEGQTPVAEWVRRELALDLGVDLREVFRNTVGVPQGTLAAAFLNAPAARKAVFDPLLRVEEYAKARARLQPTVRCLQDQRQDISLALAEAGARLDRLPQLEQLLTRLHQDMTAIEAQRDAASQEHSRHQSALDQHRVAAQALDDAQNAQALAQGAADSEQRRLSAAIALADQAEHSQSQLEASREGHLLWLAAEGNRPSIERRRHERDGLRAERGRIETRLAATADRLDSLEQDQSSLLELKERLVALEPSALRQQSLQDQVTRLDKEQVRLRERQSAHLAAQRQYEQAQKNLNRIQHERDLASELASSIESTQADLEGLQQSAKARAEQRGALDAEARRLRQQATTLQDASLARCPVCEATLTATHRLELLERNRVALSDLRERTKTLARASKKEENQEKTLRAQLARDQRRLAELAGPSDLKQAIARLAQLRDQTDAGIGLTDDLEANAARIAEARKQLAQLGDPQHQLAAGKARIERLPRLLEDIERIRDQHATERARVAKLDVQLAQYSDVDEQLRQIDAELGATRQAHDAYLAARELADAAPQRILERDAARQSAEAASKALACARTDLDRCRAAYDAQAHTETRNEVERLSATLTECETRLQERMTQRRETEKEISGLRQLALDRDAKKRDLSLLDQHLEIVQTVRDLLRQAGPLVTRELVGHVSQEAARLYSEMMGDLRCRLEWTETYEIRLAVGSNTRAFNQLSGGEQMIAALAVRLALLRRLTALDIAFFDEPTAHLDPERRERMVEQIQAISGFRQLFVISHDEAFEQVAHHSLRIVKERGKSRVEPI